MNIAQNLFISVLYHHVARSGISHPNNVSKCQQGLWAAEQTMLGIVHVQKHNSSEVSFAGILEIVSTGRPFCLASASQTFMEQANNIQKCLIDI